MDYVFDTFPEERPENFHLNRIQGN